MALIHTVCERDLSGPLEFKYFSVEDYVNQETDNKRPKVTESFLNPYCIKPSRKGMQTAFEEENTVS